MPKLASFATPIIILLMTITCGNRNEEVLKTYPEGEKQEVTVFTGRGQDRQQVSKTGYYSDGTVSFEEQYKDGEVVSYRAWWPEGERPTPIVLAAFREGIRESLATAGSTKRPKWAADLERPIDLNRASEEELQVLKGIGPVLAKRIIDYRNKHGDFQTIGELTMVKGIGPKLLMRWELFITVSPDTEAQGAVREMNDREVTGETGYGSDGARQLSAGEIRTIKHELADYRGEPAAPEEVILMETSAGIIKLRLFTDVAPGHSDNFKRLANSGFYDSTTFHRVIPGFMIQGGDINSRSSDRTTHGTGGPGYMIDAEFNPRPHVKGTLAMARVGQDPNSAGSQFYIALGRLNRLDNQYTVFGQVTEGLEVVDAIAAAPTDNRDNPINPQRILKVRVE